MGDKCDDGMKIKEKPITSCTSFHGAEVSMKSPEYFTVKMGDILSPKNAKWLLGGG